MSVLPLKSTHDLTSVKVVAEEAMSAQGTQRHSSASQSKGIVIRSTTTPYSGELPLPIRSNISQKYTARGREQFSFRDWLRGGEN